MVTDEQLAPEGKARSSQNARKHTFDAAAFAVVRLEDVAGLQRFRDRIVAAYQPANSEELDACNRLAIARHSLLRVARLEAGLCTDCLDTALVRSSGEVFQPMEQELTVDIEVVQAQNRNYALAQGFHRMIREAKSWEIFLRYKVLTEREYRRAVEELNRVRALREKLWNEPIPDPPTEPPHPDPPPPDEPLPACPDPPPAAAAPAPPVQKRENEPAGHSRDVFRRKVVARARGEPGAR